MSSNKSLTKFFVFASLIAMILLTVAYPAYAQKGDKNPKFKQPKLWQQIAENNLQRNQRAVTPEKYLVFRLNRTLLGNSLKELPFENTDAARIAPLVLEVPMPDGTIREFRMEETSVLSSELQAEFPDWKSFIGYAVDDPNVTGRFDRNVNGFHGYIQTRQGIVMIDPYAKGDTMNYMVFYKYDFGASDNEFFCRVENQMKQIVETNPTFNMLPSAPQYSFGSTVRTFRLAVATTGEWTRNAGNYPTVTDPVQLRANALGVINTTVNRLNGIYEREVASRFTVVNPPVSNNATNIVFDDPATDPYDNTDDGAQLSINQTTVDNRVGTANYDIGHLYGTGGGGVAYRGSLCQNGTIAGNTQYLNIKAGGYSARGTNTGDPFTVDYVAHEIGHQFGGSHTYNNRDGSGACTTRNAATALEPASGVTIMSYVGICNQRNLQQYVDTGLPSFHIISLTEIINNFNTGAPNDIQPCGTNGTTTNVVPTINAGAAYTIPRLTPFTLTATGTDGDGDSLLYSWEEYDAPTSAANANDPAGASGETASNANVFDVDSDGVARPIFRVYSPVSSPSRTFPSLTFILNPTNNDQTANVNSVSSNQPVLTYTGTHPTGASGAVCQPSVTCVIGERLPTIARTMNFRVSVRDSKGGIADAGTTVTVASGTGPFQILAQNARPDSPNAPQVTWQAGTTQTVNWDVAGTDANGINVANVRILLSTDGGQTFPTTLAASVPNNGSATITVPNNPTTTARIKVEAVGNIFFDINNANFAITAPTAAAVSIAGRVVSARGRGVAGATVSLTDQNGNVRTARTNSTGYYNFTGIAAGQTYIFNVTAKNYQFAPQALLINEDVAALNFMAQ